jgi:hypothetical protein
MKIVILALFLNLLSHIFLVRFFAFHRKMNDLGEESERRHRIFSYILLVPPLAFVVASMLIILGIFLKDKKL